MPITSSQSPMRRLNNALTSQLKTEVCLLTKTLWRPNLFQFCVGLLEVYPSTFLPNDASCILGLICSCTSAVMTE